MRWLVGLPAVQVVLSGMSDIEQVDDNANTFEQILPLTEDEQKVLHRAALIQRNEVAVTCTSCRYCCADCPLELDIPELMKLYNEFKLGGAWRLAGIDAMPEDKKPSACIGCGACTEHCPQGLEIPKLLKEMQEAFDDEMSK